MTLPILLTLIAAFAGGAVSTAFAEWIRDKITYKSRRAALFRRVYDEVAAWVRNMGDLYIQGTGEILAVSPFKAASVEDALERGLFDNSRDAEFRNALLATQRAMIRYNGDYDLAVLLQAQHLSLGRTMRQGAANYAHQTLLPRLQTVYDLLREKYNMKD